MGSWRGGRRLADMLNGESSDPLSQVRRDVPGSQGLCEYSLIHYPKSLQQGRLGGPVG